MKEKEIKLKAKNETITKVNNNNITFKMNNIKINKLIIGVCVRVKDEQKIIKDWVNHYLKLDFDYIYIYDNLSNPSVENTLGNYDKNKIKIKIDKVIASNQTDVYQDCLNNNKHLDWLLICDADEFLYIKNGNIKDFLNSFSNDTGTIFINWLVFGTSNLQTYDLSKNIFEQFIKREPYNFFWNEYVKSFIRPKYIKTINGWHKIFNNSYKTKDVYNNSINLHKTNRYSNIKLNDNTPVILIHYMTLDFESMLIKRERNSKFSSTVENSDKYTIEWYNNNFKDEIIDDRMIKYYNNNFKNDMIIKYNNNNMIIKYNNNFKNDIINYKLINQ